MDPAQLARSLNSARTGGVWCDIRKRDRDGAPTSDELDAFAFSVLGPRSPDAYDGGYHEITLDRARMVLAHWMRCDQAYGPHVVGPSLWTSELDQFFGAFSESARYFTNNGNDGTSTPKTSYTFDTGVIAVDQRAIGLVWSTDED